MYGEPLGQISSVVATRPGMGFQPPIFEVIPKHALLAQLAREQGVDIALTIGMYQMTERNTPGVGSVLEHYNLPYIPEAHCYLTYNGIRIDVTRSGVTPVEPITDFLYEETITPEHIGAYKIALHQRVLRDWVAGSRVSKNDH